MTSNEVNKLSDDQLFDVLRIQLAARIEVSRTSPEFPEELKKLPKGFRAMASTYELDVSLTLDDLGWHLGNWHSHVLSEETIAGLKELEANELTEVFSEAYQIAKEYWSQLSEEKWHKWYSESPLESKLSDLNEKAWEVLDGESQGIFSYWITYARKHPDIVNST